MKIRKIREVNTLKFRRRMSVSEHRRLPGYVSLALRKGHLRFRHKKSVDARVEMPRLMPAVHVPRYENIPFFLYSIMDFSFKSGTIWFLAMNPHLGNP